jgi:hypothetical protein
MQEAQIRGETERVKDKPSSYDESPFATSSDKQKASEVQSHHQRGRTTTSFQAGLENLSQNMKGISNMDAIRRPNTESMNESKTSNRSNSNVVGKTRFMEKIYNRQGNDAGGKFGSPARTIGELEA